MFKSYEFTYAGMPASMFSMYVADISGKSHSANSFGNKANIIEKRLANRITPLHYGVRYNDSPLSFTLIFGADHELDRYEMQAVSRWLTGYQEYQWLSIDQPDMNHIQFRCLIQELTPIHLRWLPMAFEAKIICDCPYGYSYPFQKIHNVIGNDESSSRYVFYNDSTCSENLRAHIYIDKSAGGNSFSIRNITTNTEMKFEGLPIGALSIHVDAENQIVSDETEGATSSSDLYEYFNFVFLDFAPGDNELLITGNGGIRIEGRYLYNVGA